MFPRSCLLYLTNDCYLNCSHCAIVCKNNPSYMSYSCFKQIMSLLKKNKCYITAITGGDPLLHPDLFELLEEIRQNNMLAVLGISGIGLDDTIVKKIVKSKVGCVQVSLDGSTENYNSVFRVYYLYF